MPQDNTSNGGQLPGWLESIIDTATGTFEKWADYELAQQELDVAKDFQFFKTAKAFELEQQQVKDQGGGALTLGNNTMLLLLLAAGGLAAIVALR